MCSFALLFLPSQRIRLVFIKYAAYLNCCDFDFGPDQLAFLMVSVTFVNLLIALR